MKRRAARADSFFLTCEHGGHRIPPGYRSLFAGAKDVLKSHRGWDPGALRVAEAMSAILNAPLFSSTTSRLLVELNRSHGHPSLFSEYTDFLPELDKQQLIAQHWRPYRDQVTQHLDKLMMAHRRVIHLSIHSFTPVWQGKARSTSIGLLYDPRRVAEKEFCNAWKGKLREQRPDYTIHSNQPYKGIADGFTTSLRRRFDSNSNVRGTYVGVEVEINQALIAPATDRQIQSMAELLTIL
jgi:predicted N-formylglutamate amidohydrolase